MPDCIKLLPDHVANQIAAGEVVQRPASVVKELLENAIDAQATEITLLLKEAGKARIQVIDNGVGMSITDARMSFERHATSKISDANDLFNLTTKGFRGEAMASIAAIAHVEMKTKTAGETLGTCLQIEGSKVMSQEAVATPVGTSIAVKNLFFNIPARRNFLKSDTVETRHVVDEFQRVALVHPNIAFTMIHNSTEVYQLKASNLKQRIVAIFGGKTNEKLVPIQEKTDILTITGFVGKPEFAKRKRGEQFFFANTRFIKSPYLHHAVTAAFEGLMGQGVYPSYFLYLEVPPESIDINIHPTKTEVKFDDEKVLYAMIKSVVKHSLGQYNVMPVLDFNKDASLDTPYEYKNKPVKEPTITVDPTFNPFTADQKSPNSASKVSYQKEKPTAAWESLYSGLEAPQTSVIAPVLEPQKFEFESPESSAFEGGKTFQIHKKYILSTIKSGVVLVHQNLAHQKVLYEEFLKSNHSKNTFSQQLLFPVEVSFVAQEIETIKSFKENLEQLGFLFGEISDSQVVIKGIPPVITESQISITMEQLLDDIEQEMPEVNFNPLLFVAKSLAKTLAIKTGQLLSEKEQLSLVDKLFLCENPEVAPNGKKTYTTVGINKLDNIFSNVK